MTEARLRRTVAGIPLPGRRSREGHDPAGRSGRTPVDGRLSPVHGATRTLRGPQRERHEPDFVILVTVVALSAVGILMVYSTSGVDAYLAFRDTFALVSPQLLWGLMGVVAMLVLMRLDYRYLRLVSVPAYVVALALLVVVLIPGVGEVVGGSARWLEIEPLPRVHPAEFAKLALVVYLAHWLAKKGTRIGSLVHGLVPFLVIAGSVIVLVALEPDLGTTGVITLAAFTMLFAAGGSIWQMALMVPPGIAGVYLVVNLNAYQMDRIRAFLDPWADPQGIGFHTVQGLLALGLGGVTGTGLGQSQQPGSLVVPNAQNDFVFAVVGQELGLLGGVGVVVMFLLFAYRGIRVALGAPDTFGALLATGITGWLALQAFINIGVVVALIPITGITLPFVSDGGSSLIVSFAAVGILLSISRETQPRGTWNDADPHRGRRYGRPHLPRRGGPRPPSRAGR